MELKLTLQKITEELSACFATLDESQLQELKQNIKKADKVFVAGAGRSLMMIRGLAMRLMHMGINAYVVGETVTPAIEPGDLLIIASGSGSTGTLVTIAEKCKKIGADLALITTMPASPIGQKSDCIVRVNAATTKSDDNTLKSIQPGASTFEQSVLLIGDALVLQMMNELGSLEHENELLMKKHANLE